MWKMSKLEKTFYSIFFSSKSVWFQVNENLHGVNKLLCSLIHWEHPWSWVLYRGWGCMGHSSLLSRGPKSNSKTDQLIIKVLCAQGALLPTPRAKLLGVQRRAGLSLGLHSHADCGGSMCDRPQNISRSLAGRIEGRMPLANRVVLTRRTSWSWRVNSNVRISVVKSNRDKKNCLWLDCEEL